MPWIREENQTGEVVAAFHPRMRRSPHFQFADGQRTPANSQKLQAAKSAEN
jgi:hypothetical protein